ncbi:MAG: AAA family ATPase [Kiritimatiellae bacterium]|nr:AAA family ATPase [Kiritimatiellia bacterium]
MGISGKNAASVGLGCLVDVALFVVLVLAFPEDCAVSTLIYMMAMAIPVWIVRIAVFNERTPRWARILIGPLGALVCLALAIAHPIALEDSSEADETPATNNASSAAGSASPATNAVESVEEVLAELDSLVGLEEVKSEVRKIVNLAKVNEARRAQGLKVPPMTYHMVFTGNPGTGKTTVARIVARAFRALGIAKTGQLVETDRSGLVGRYEGETAVKTNAKIDEAIGGILFVDEAYQLVSGENDDYGKEAIATLLKRMEDDRDRLIVIAAGYTDEMRDFLDANSGLRSRFPRMIEFADYTAPELAAIFRSMAKKNEFALAPDLDAGLDAAIAKLTAKRDRTFGNARFVRQLFEDATARQATRLAESGELDAEALKTLALADLSSGERKEDIRAPKIEDVLAELDSLVGLQPVKDEVRRLVATVRANKLRAEKGLENNVTMSYNFVFTGNPGTGKTTVARILGKAFRALGVLERANFVETDRSGLVAKYEGQTAAKTNKLIDSAAGGILFIDEAYQLNQGENDQYGAEAVATLLKRMEDARGSMVVIIAGYKEEMKRFMAINSGLESRFNRTVEFPDYSAKELAEVYRSMAKKAKYRLSDDTERWLLPYISMLTEKRDKNFGNARWARNLFEKSVERQSLRVTELPDPSAEELVTIRLKDLGVKLKDPAASDED